MKRLMIVVMGLLFAGAVFAADPGIPFMTANAQTGGTQYSLPIQTLLFLTALGFLPALLLMMTAFTRIVIVLSLLRQALGTMQAPPNQVIVGMSLFLTFFVMSPVFDKIYQVAYQPYAEQKIGFNQAVEKGVVPLKDFMLKQTRQKDLAFFIDISGAQKPNGPEDVSLRTLVPAFVTSELKTAFQIGFIVFIPFIIIDFVVASILMAMGMMMVSPVIISLPFKLMLFVLVDGWALLMGSLVQSFYVAG
ncbi:flagellar type III secretion system pore protein FliP [Iodobacter fluviatilis]|uniref:Flagellar biosynthetic protein FliP n=2 Tax=Iodobacter fluviatilis TaxID=537 RepID=A0A377SW28_9NEIS|nr:flagellar type III secretion system pore protein FliP [Iodobacter fluviatilis]TCU88094.1 flagellar biosynthetic protein FliP [Iodobacter fluviatilis]STR45595.1 Flagellar biosynthetic protein fliP precursor [Iodobacter fluviatilis]